MLNELAAAASRKVGMSLFEIQEKLNVVRAVCDVESISEATRDRGIAACERYGLSVHDSMIVASALAVNYRVLYCEDRNDGRLIDEQLSIRDPFNME